MKDRPFLAPGHQLRTFGTAMQVAEALFALGLLERYVIYGEPVYSPCDGTITAAVDRYADLRPPKRDTEHPAGNHVIIECRGVKLLLAHLQQDSVTVDTGEEVATGQQLGRVGNTGNTTEPHLHIHAVEANSGGVMHGTPVPILFDGEFGVRNMVFAQHG